MIIEKHKVVVLNYELEVEGKIIDKSSSDKPLDYIQGCHMLIPGFENALEGKKEGDSFDFTVSPEDGYGVYDEEARFDVPKTAFEYEGKIREDLLFVGNMVPMQTADGQVMNAVISQVKDDAVTMDFNHPLAGKNLHFSGTVISVREATKKELDEGLHGEFLPPAEGCHCQGQCNHDGSCCSEGGCEGEGSCGECHCKE